MLHITFVSMFLYEKRSNSVFYTKNKPSKCFNSRIGKSKDYVVNDGIDFSDVMAGDYCRYQNVLPLLIDFVGRHV